MKQLYYVRKEKLEWRDIPIPTIEHPVEALVRPFVVARCDIDNVFLFNNIDRQIRIGKFLGKVDPKFTEIFGKLFKGPFPIGHECVAEVLEVGDHVKCFKPGDVVSVPFQISCGTCSNCLNDLTGFCERVETHASYGLGKHLSYGGALSDLLKIPFADAMLVKIPEEIDPVQIASLSDNIPDAYRHLKVLEKDNDQAVLIIGGKAKSIGLYTILLARAMGATRVDYVDRDPERLRIALSCGPDRIYEHFSQIDQKYDLVVDASSTPKGLQSALSMVKNSGLLSSSGIYLRKADLSLIQMYGNGVTLQSGWSNARSDAEKVLDLLKTTFIDFGLVTSRLDTWDNAIEAFLSDTTKVVVTRNKMFVKPFELA